MSVVRGVIYGGVLIVWVAVLATLVLHEPSPTQRRPEVTDLVVTAAETTASDGDWWGVYLQGHKVGFVRYMLTRRSDAVSFQQESVLRLTTLGQRQVIRTQAIGEMTPSFAVRSMEFSLIAGPTRLQLRATAVGDRLRVTTADGGAVLDLDGTISLPVGLRAAAMQPPLEAGRVVRGQVFDPLSKTSSLLELRVLRQEPLPGNPGHRAWRLAEKWRDVESTLWVDDQGRLLREEGPMGLVAVRETQAQAMSLPSAGTQDWDAVDAVAVRIARPLANPRTRESLRLRLSGIESAKIPTGNGQTVDPAGMSIRRLQPTEMVSYGLPYAAANRAAELAATDSLQARHPRIVSLAEEIIGDEGDALAATQLLVDWVYRYLNKVPTASLPNALEVLDIGQGDCTEHAVLLTALCRAVGIPARLTGGLVYGEGAFLYHAWTEVWLGQWVPVDAALNQVPADATHIRLVEGDGEQQLLLMMGMIGNLSIEILDADDAERRS